ncbi:MAG TPA: MFS transporter [Streptosporangiaceae bacterium]|nr:MFS transporter [Streptosporangiaceae bacterium]
MPDPVAAESGASGAPEVVARATFGQVFALGEFRALWAAQILSVAGDQLARVALTLLVFVHTRSALLAAVTFAASVVPTFVGGVLLAGLADRMRRRELMIVCDLARALLVAVMALPGIPIAGLIALLFLVTLVGAPFSAARAALYPDILQGDRYVLGTAVTLTTVQFAQVIGFATGGVLVGFFGVRTSLVVDAATFMLSALFTLAWVHTRPAASSSSRTPSPSRAGAFTGVRLVFADARLRTPMLLAWLVAFTDIYEGVAAPLAKRAGAGPTAVGLILASGALGATVGSLAFGRFVRPERRIQLMGPLAIAACGVLVLFAVQPGLVVSLLVLGISGACCCYQLAANAAFVTAAPTKHRSQAFGVAQGGINLSAGTAMIVAGALTDFFPPTLVLAGGGVLGVLAGLAIARTGPRTGETPL